LSLVGYGPFQEPQGNNLEPLGGLRPRPDMMLEECCKAAEAKLHSGRPPGPMELPGWTPGPGN
jgi:hypothetical protein